MSGSFSGGKNVDFSGVCAANANLSLRRAFAFGARPAPGKALTGRCFRLYIRALAGAATGLGFGVQTSLKPALTASDASRLQSGGMRVFSPPNPRCGNVSDVSCFRPRCRRARGSDPVISLPVRLILPLPAGAGERQNASPPCIQAMCRQKPLCAAFRKIYGINLGASFYLRGVAFCGAFTGARPGFMEFRIMAWDALSCARRPKRARRKAKRGPSYIQAGWSWMPAYPP